MNKNSQIRKQKKIIRIVAVLLTCILTGCGSHGGGEQYEG